MKVTTVVRILSLSAALALLAGCAGSSYHGSAAYSSGYPHGHYHGYHSHHHYYRGHHYYDRRPGYYRERRQHRAPSNQGANIQVNEKLPIRDKKLRELVQ